MRPRRWAEALKLVAGFCAVLAVLSAALYAGAGQRYGESRDTAADAPAR